MQRKYAFACHVLGNSAPLKTYAQQIEKGVITLPANNEPNTNENDQPGNVELTGIVGYLIRANLPECDRALSALAAPAHPYHSLVKQRVTYANSWDEEKGVWLGHPFCLEILRAALNDTKPTGFTWQIEDDYLNRSGEGGSSSESIPDFLTDPSVRREKAEERICDVAANKIADLVYGIPCYNPLFKNAEERLGSLKTLIDHYRGHYRILTGTEKNLLGLMHRDAKLVPVISPLDHPATAEDVQQGLAIFHLDGKGTLAKIQLPAVASVKKEQQGQNGPPVLIVQAEVNAEGKTLCGIITAHEIKTVDLEELKNIKPIPKEK